MSSSNSKRIAKNTIFLYIRMLLIMAVTLYTSRIILHTLGVEDFGIYNLVGGVASSFIFFSSSLSNATQRYLNFELGSGDISKVRNIFNMSLLINSILALIVFIVAELIGVWLIDNKLVIPEERIFAASCVFHTTMLSLLLTFIGSVFDSVLIARENMKVYAYIGIIEAITKLLIAYCIVLSSFDKLILYSLLMFGLIFLIKAATAIYCFRHYQECKLQYYWNPMLFKEMFGFIGWNGFGTAVWMINEQGMNILMNLFFGPIVNAARAVATQVNSAINNFSNNFFTAVRPQIVKCYAAGDYNYFIKLIFASSRYSFYLIWLLCLPVIMRSDYILNLWLKDVPDYSVEFVRWILIYSSVNVLTNPIWSAIQAIGKLKRYIIIGSTVFLMAFPISYILLKLGYSPVISFQVLTVVRIAYLFVTIKILRDYINFSLKQYLSIVLLPITSVGILSFICTSFANGLFEQNFISLILISGVSILITLIFILLLGVTAEERLFVRNKILKLFQHD